VLAGDLRAVAEPTTYHVRRERFLQFCLSTCSQVVKDTRPRNQTRSLYNSGHLSAEV
jgi:hypothetical protein